MRQTRAHEGSVFTLCTLQDGALLSGGGKDRKIIRWSADLAPERECEVNHDARPVSVCLSVASAVQTAGPYNVHIERKYFGLLGYPDSREVWDGPHHCRHGRGGAAGWYHAKRHSERNFL